MGKTYTYKDMYSIKKVKEYQKASKEKKQGRIFMSFEFDYKPKNKFQNKKR